MTIVFVAIWAVGLGLLAWAEWPLSGRQKWLLGAMACLGAFNIFLASLPASSTDSLPSTEVLPGIAPGQVNKKESHDQ